MLKISQLFKKESQLYSITKGKTVKLENVNDPVFSEKMMGDGIAFSLCDNVIYSPCDAKIMFVANTLHAIGLKSASGVEIMIHIGLNTVDLDGNGFKKLFEGNKVKIGQPLIEIDTNFMNENNIDLTTMMIITNSTEYKILNRNEDNLVETKDVVLEVTKR